MAGVTPRYKEYTGTDPPYDRSTLRLYGELSAWAERVLVDGGHWSHWCLTHARWDYPQCGAAKR